MPQREKENPVFCLHSSLCSNKTFLQLIYASPGALQSCLGGCRYCQCCFTERSAGTSQNTAFRVVLPALTTSSI